MSDPSKPVSGAVTPDNLGLPRGLTPARLALGRAGAGLPTRSVLDFALAHAEARDAVHAGLDRTTLADQLVSLGLDTVLVESAAPDRDTYLRRPDFGRRLSRNSRSVLAVRPRAHHDVTIVVGDGLSARATAENVVPLLQALVPLLLKGRRSLGPIVLAEQARVALGDEAASILGGRLVLMLLGERPGLSSADSLGAYVTLGPKIGRTDAERNCVSNIRPAGLKAEDAARTIAWIVDRAFALGSSGVHLKDESGTAFPLLSAQEEP